MIAALFPGQGSQRLGMAQDLYAKSPAAKAVLDAAEAALPGLLDIMFSGPEEALTLTANQQPALVAAGASAFRAFEEAGGPKPDLAAGHSLGEFTAHVAAGSLDVGDAVKLVRNRGTYMQEAVPAGMGAMAAVLKVDDRAVADACRKTPGVVEIANLNAPGQTVISGEREAVAEACSALRSAGARVVPLPVSAPFHCSLMRPAAERLAHDLGVLRFCPGAFPVVANVTAAVVKDVTEIAALLQRQVTAPVRWVESIMTLHASGVTRFVEFGSGNVLCGLVKRIVPEARVHAVVDTTSLKEAL